MSAARAVARSARAVQAFEINLLVTAASAAIIFIDITLFEIAAASAGIIAIAAAITASTAIIKAIAAPAKLHKLIL